MHICLRQPSGKAVFNRLAVYLTICYDYIYATILRFSMTCRTAQVDQNDDSSFVSHIYPIKKFPKSIQHLSLHRTNHPCADSFAVLRIHCREVFVIHTGMPKSVICVSKENNIDTHVMSLSVVSNNSISTSLITVANARYISAYARFNPRHMRVPLPKGTK